MEEGLESEVGEVRGAFERGRTRSLSWRRSQLRALLKLLKDEEDDIFKALKEDVGKHHVEAFRDEVGVLIKSIDFALGEIKRWMAPQRVWVPLVAFPTTAEVVPEPLGVVLIFSCWNFPLNLSLEPLIGAICAGNGVVLKPSELAPATSQFLACNIPKYLDSKAVKVVQGGAEVGQQLLELKWDKIFFTGGRRVGQIVMTAAAKHLTPVAIEVGGKCPAIIDSFTTAKDRKVTVERVVGGKWGPCAGQACIAIDYLLVEEEFAPVLVELLKATIAKFFTAREYVSRIVNKHHFERLSRLLEDKEVAASIKHGGLRDPENLFIEPTILLNPPLDAEIMTEEIFGPLLPIITLKKIEDSIEFVRARPKPLVIYAFTHNEMLKKRIVEETSSGSVTFNDAIIQFLLDALPFGGIGQSGFGQYHGKYSFDLFSHRKSVVRRSFLTEFSFRYPPWDERKLQLLRYAYSFDYVRFVLYFLGLKR
ncbi:Aldehyde dehydrogenase family 3 member F1 [Ananas comosus]|uniref:Aldehyde dehydrogenase n=1 Tax=Ananas comosus TaxID=4615 RepID=A0A199V0S6_ANACO|nr:Aldehyde dehydrogenase family 3 member F1 [Ananas comosus]